MATCQSESVAVRCTMEPGSQWGGGGGGVGSGRGSVRLAGQFHLYICVHLDTFLKLLFTINTVHPQFSMIKLVAEPQTGEYVC